MVANSPSPRKIIHCDCDCFYAAVEVLDNPRFGGRPLAVGGSAEQRGVIATCNYEARAFGVRSAMPTGKALRLCPDLILVPPRMNRYREVSRKIMAIYRDYSEQIEPLSLDEAYIDVTGARACQGSATLIAEEIRRRVRQEVGVTVSAGVAPNKFIAKVASDWNKPDGLKVVTPEQVPEFVQALPIESLYGVGKVTAARIRNMGVSTCGELQQFSLVELEQEFGSFGTRLYQLCRGIDEREVSTSRVRKSVSVEETFSQDLDREACLRQLPALFEDLTARLQRVASRAPIDKSFVKLRFADFVSTTLERQLQPSLEGYEMLFEEAFQRGARKVRLLGLGVRFREPERFLGQLDLFETSI